MVFSIAWMSFGSLLALSGTAITAHASAVLNARQSTLPAGWTSLGCYSDSTSSRTLKVASFTNVTGMTIESCIAFCTPSAYNYAGVEFARECYCDNVIEAPGAPISSGCNMPCTGNSAEICGGANAINVFSSPVASSTTSSGSTTTTATTTTTSAPPTPTIQKSVGTFQYVGCFQDAVSSVTSIRTLATQLTVSGGVNAERCTAACKANGFPLAGLEFGQECWCDDYMQIVTLSPDTDCNKPCVADATELCGAGNRLAVYQDTSAVPPDPTKCLSNSQIFEIDLVLKWLPMSGGSPAVLTGLPITGNDSSLTQVANIVALTDNLNGIADVFFLRNFGPNVFELELIAGFENLEIFAGALSVSAGGAQLFLSSPNPGTFSVTPFDQYCAMPNPVAPFGPFIGPAVLALFTFIQPVSNQWALCTNTTAAAEGVFIGRSVVYAPAANNPDYVLADCQPIWIQLAIL